MFNALYTTARAYKALPEGGNKDAQLHVLKAQQKKYTKSVEAQVRRDRNAGGGRAPKTTVEIGMLLYRQMRRLNETLDGLHDLLRYNVSLSLPRRYPYG
jgi:23S rRNA maturation mini-RNase III